MKNLNQALLKKFVKLAGERLKGDWLLMGGTVLPALGAEHRVTTDIDIASLSETTQAQTLQLMTIAEELGLPAETINSAGEFFLKKQKPSKKDFVLLHDGPSAKIFRPGLNLFLRMKAARMTDSDLMDCLAMLKLFRAEKKESIEALMTFLEQEVAKCESLPRKNRLETLLKALQKQA